MSTVLKFGGTSMGDEDTWKRVLDIIANYDEPVVVVSATSKTTRKLISAADSALDRPEDAYGICSDIQTRHEQIVAKFLEKYASKSEHFTKVKESSIQWIERHISDLRSCLEHINTTKLIDSRLIDYIAALGEKLSSFLLAECGKAYGLQTSFVEAGEIIKTDSDFGKARPYPELIRDNISILLSEIDHDRIPVMGGYYGTDQDGDITTLGFEGSDYTATLVGSALQSDLVEIWTDVDGIFTCDPRLIPEAKLINEISFREATEMAYFGAKVLHPSTMNPVMEKNITVYVKNIFNPASPGTKICADGNSKQAVTALTYLEDIIVLTISDQGTVMGYQFLARIFELLNSYHLTVDVVTTTEASVSIALEKPDNLAGLKMEMEQIGTLLILEKQGLLTLIGCSFSKPGEISEKVFSAIDTFDTKLISFNNVKKNLNIVLPEDQLLDAAKAIHSNLY